MLLWRWYAYFSFTSERVPTKGHPVLGRDVLYAVLIRKGKICRRQSDLRKSKNRRLDFHYGR